MTLPEWPSFCFEYRQNFGFAPNMIESGRLPDMSGPGQTKGDGAVHQKKGTHKHIIDVCVFRRFWSTV